MKYLMLFLLAFTAAWAEEPVRGDIHAVVEADGTISYYLRTAGPGKFTSPTPAIGKEGLKQYFAADAEQAEAFAIFEGENETAGFYLTPESHKQVEPVDLALEQGFKAKAIPYDELPDSFSTAYKLTNAEGALGGVWLATDALDGVSTVGALIPEEWSASRIINVPAYSAISARAIPVPRDEFIESLRKSMLQQAINLACKSEVVPKEISVTATLAASVGLIVGGEGSIAFAATWDTMQLCK